MIFVKVGLSIKYIIEDTPKGTGGILPVLKDCVKDDFLLVFGDLVFDFSIPRMLDAYKKKKALITLFSHPNSHPYDSDLLLTDTENKVIGYCSKHEIRHGFYKNLVIVNPLNKDEARF
jgi:NDP-sugar pyrophosphorylase family protein